MAKDPVSVDAAGTASAFVTFPAVDATEAANKVRGWVLHEGCAITLSFSQMARPIETDLDGVPGLVDLPAAEPVAQGVEE